MTGTVRPAQPGPDRDDITLSPFPSDILGMAKSARCSVLHSLEEILLIWFSVP
jgi:hypothetical protein